MNKIKGKKARTENKIMKIARKAIQTIFSEKNILLIVLIFLTISLASCNNLFEERISKKAKTGIENGILNLQREGFGFEKVISLAGEWQFIFGKHISPDAGEDIWQKESILFKLPATWKGQYYRGRKLPGSGIATYRLRIMTDEPVSEELALLIPGWETAYSLFVNGELVASAGIVGKTQSETIPAWKPQVISFNTSEKLQEIVIQIANFSHARGGPAMVPYLGSVESITKMREKGIAQKAFSFGSLFMIAFYHFVIFLLRRKEKSALFFFLFCLSMALRALVIEEHILLLAFPNLDWNIHLKLTYLPFATAVGLFTLFLKSLYSDEMYQILTNTIVFISGVYAIFILITPARFYTEILIYFQIVLFFASVYSAVVLFKAFRKKREGAIHFLVAFFTFFLAILNDLLHHNHLISTGYYAPAGFTLFIFIQAGVLARRYSKSFSRIEELSSEKVF